MRSGLTLIEVTLSLGLLGLLSLAVLSWTSLARGAWEASETGRWEAAAESVLRSVRDDALTGDLAGGPRVHTGRGVLSIETRQQGECVRQYRLDVGTGRLSVATLRDGQRRTSARVLLDEVGRWDCEWDADTERLTVSVARQTGETATSATRSMSVELP